MAQRDENSSLTAPAQATRPATSRRGAPAAFAALDLGTNNCRLLVARALGHDFEVVDAFSRAVRLGEGVEVSGRLSEIAQDRAIKALRICAAKIRHHRVRHRRIVATEACRRAVNGAEFIARVARETGLPLAVVSAEEEARLAVAGCAPLIDPKAEQLLVFDIGGGSTELIWVDLSTTPPQERAMVVRALSPVGGLDTAAARAAAARIADWISLPMGVSTLNDRFAHIGCERARYAAMADCFETALARFSPYAKRESTAIERLQIIGVSGTATTFGAIHLGLRSYDRKRVDGMWLPSARALTLARRLLDMGADGRSTCPGIGRGRADLVLSGAAILTTILSIWPVPSLRIADRGLREGILYGLLQQHKLLG
ncbi:MAG: Ppx/GppA phosphatase family protein [Pseudomonadota bacterium]